MILKSLNISLMLFILFFNNLCADDARKYQIDGAELTGHETYDSETLSDYINGEALIYNEYGFEKLDLLKYDTPAGNFTVQVFEMADPMAAFGMFSIRRDTSGLIRSEAYLYSRSYQTNFLQGRYFVKIIHPNSDAARDFEKNFLAEIRKQLPEYEGYYGLDDIITDPGDPKKIKILKYIKGKTALEYVIPLWMAQFHEIDSIRIWLLKNPAPWLALDDLANYALIEFNSRADMMAYLSRLDLDEFDPENGYADAISLGMKYSMWMVGEKKIIYAEAAAEEPKLIKFMQEARKAFAGGW